MKLSIKDNIEFFSDNIIFTSSTILSSSFNTSFSSSLIPEISVNDLMNANKDGITIDIFSNEKPSLSNSFLKLANESSKLFSLETNNFRLSILSPIFY